MKKRPTVNKKHFARTVSGSSMARHKKSRKKTCIAFFYYFL